MADRYPFLVSDSELVLLNNAINSHLLTLDPTGPTFDRDVDEFLTLKDRVDSECDWRDQQQALATGGVVRGNPYIIRG